MGNNIYNNNVTKEDDDYIYQNYKTQTVKEIAEKLNKKPGTIYKAMRRLGISTGTVWTDEEIEYLKNNIQSQTYKEIGLYLDRTPKSVSGKAHYLGLVKSSVSKNWTTEEIDILRKNVKRLNYEEIQKLLPNRTIASIYNKVYELGLNLELSKGYRKLKTEQIFFILENCQSMTDCELAEKFKVSESAIRDVRRKNGIKKDPLIKNDSFIELKVKQYLESKGIEFLHHQRLGEYEPDFQLVGTKIIIEVQGDYFHCNPKLYPKGPKNENQIKYVIRDYYKKCFYLGNDYVLIEIWEDDIRNNFDKVIKQIENAYTAVCG